jgi:hypothetical protein
MLDVGMLQAIILTKMEDADVDVEDALAGPKTTLPTEDSLVPAGYRILFPKPASKGSHTI